LRVNPLSLGNLRLKKKFRLKNDPNMA